MSVDQRLQDGAPCRWRVSCCPLPPTVRRGDLWGANVKGRCWAGSHSCLTLIDLRTFPLCRQLVAQADQTAVLVTPVSGSDAYNLHAETGRVRGSTTKATTRARSHPDARVIWPGTGWNRPDYRHSRFPGVILARLCHGKGVSRTTLNSGPAGAERELPPLSLSRAERLAPRGSDAR